MIFDAENFLIDHGIRYISEGTKHCQAGWIQMECPFCTGNAGHHLGYNLSKDFFNCWRCGFHSTIEVIHAFSLVGWEKAKQMRKDYVTHMSNRSHLIPERSGEKASKVIYPIGTEEPTRRHLSYLESRGYDPERIVKEWGLLGTGPIGPYKHRVIAPIHYHKHLVSFQGRDYTGKSDLKYKACPQDMEVIDHKKVLYGLDQVVGKMCVLVEGITDVWRLGPGAVASFGIETKPSQIYLMAEKMRKVFVMFDDDPQAVKQAEEIAYNLAMCGVDCEICLIDGDPGGLDQDTADDYMADLLG